jgi:hypothetical protein
MKTIFSRHTKRKAGEQFATGFLLVSALFFMVIFGAITLQQFLPNKSAQVTADETEYVERELLRRSVGDCTLERTEYGWKCTEIGTGKIFKVVVK